MKLPTSRYAPSSSCLACSTDPNKFSRLHLPGRILAVMSYRFRRRLELFTHQSDLELEFVTVLLRKRRARSTFILSYRVSQTSKGTLNSKLSRCIHRSELLVCRSSLQKSKTDTMIASLDPSILRHFYVSFPRLNRACEIILAKSIKGMPRLQTFSLAHDSEHNITTTSPYQLRWLGQDLPAALAGSSTLKSIYICGYAFSQHNLCTFPMVDSLVLSAIHDSALSLLPLMPALKKIKIWRDFAVRFEGELDWCTDTMVQKVRNWS